MACKLPVLSELRRLAYACRKLVRDLYVLKEKEGSLSVIDSGLKKFLNRDQ